MKPARALLVAFAALGAACGGSGESNPPPAVDVSGIWAGDVTSTDGQGQPVYGTYRATFSLAQSGSSVSGSYAGSASVGGAVVAGVSANRVVGIITPRECRGELHLAATVRDGSPPTMDVEYSGTTECAGARVDRGTLTRQ